MLPRGKNGATWWDSDTWKAERAVGEKEIDMKQKEEEEEGKKMDLREIETIVKEGDGGVIGKKESLLSNLTTNESIDSANALQLFLDHIPISSIPGIQNSPSSVLELKTQDCLMDAIQFLYKKNVYGAPIADIIDPELTIPKFSDRFIGFIDFASMVLWSVEECENHHKNTKDDGVSNIKASGFFSMLQQIPHIAQTKIGELAKSFLWESFFPVHLDDTLFHVLLLLSKHKLHVVPVIEHSNSNKVIGFVSENAVIQLLLQSSGLEWFDSIADKALSEFENAELAVSIYGDQSIAEAMHVLWENQTGAIAVIQRETERLIGCMSCSDLYLLLDDDDLFNNVRSLTMEKFIHLDTSTVDSDSAIDRDLGALISAGTLTLRNKFLPRMDSPVTNSKTDTLKQVMEKLADTKGKFSFLVDESRRVRGLLTLRDIIIQFAPPCMDSTINGGGFFESALEQTGCHVGNGTIICDH